MDVVFSTDTYDCAIGSGLVCPGRIYIECIHEMIRITKPGNHLDVAIYTSSRFGKWNKYYGRTRFHEIRGNILYCNSPQRSVKIETISPKYVLKNNLTKPLLFILRQYIGSLFFLTIIQNYFSRWFGVEILINLIHKSHNELIPYTTMHLFVTEMCTCAHFCYNMVYSGMFV